MNRLLLIAAAAYLLVAGCSSPDDRVAGSSSRVGNAFGVTGTVAGAPGTGVSPRGADAVLFAITADDSGRYDWYALDSTVTDTDGTFLFEDLDDGYYSVVLEKDSLKAFSGYLHYLTAETLLDVGNVLLDRTVTVSGEIFYEDSVNYAFINLGLVGTNYSNIKYIDKAFNLINLPKGEFKLEIRLMNFEGEGSLKDGYITLPSNGDMSLVSTYDDLPPLLPAQVDTIIPTNDSISVSGMDFDIEFVIH